MTIHTPAFGNAPGLPDLPDLVDLADDLSRARDLVNLIDMAHNTSRNGTSAAASIVVFALENVIQGLTAHIAAARGERINDHA